MYLVKCEPIYIVKGLDFFFFCIGLGRCFAYLLMVLQGGRNQQKQARKTIDVTAIYVLQMIS